MSVQMNIDGTLVPISGSLYHNEMFPGQITMGANVTAPYGWLLCDGTSYNKTDYPALYAAIGDTYNQPDTPATKFCVPNMADRAVYGASIDHPLGTNIDESLPNIIGSFEAHSNGWNGAEPVSGSFSHGKMSSNGCGMSSDDYRWGYINFNAASGELSVSPDTHKVYQDNAHVFTNGIALNYFIKY